MDTPALAPPASGIFMTIHPSHLLILAILGIPMACGGGAKSTFVAPPAPSAAPTVTSFTPSGFPAGATVTLTGTRFLGTSQVQFNGVNASGFFVDSDTQIKAVAPDNLSAGLLSVRSGQGLATSTTPFSVVYEAPSISSLSPVQGPPGIQVVLSGAHLGYPGTSLTYNGRAVVLVSQSATRISFTVPADAVSGAIVVTTPGGSTAAQPFTILNPALLDLHIEKVQLTQSTQTLDNTVPVVAGKNGLIRVFPLANQVNTASPLVRVNLLNDGVPVHGYPKLIAAPGTGVPTTLDESSLTSSWNLAVAGADLTTPTGSGFSVVAEVDPSALIPEVDKNNNSLKVSLDVRTVPVFRITLFPVVLSNGTGNVKETNKVEWVDRLARMFPVAGTDIQVGSPFTPSVTSLASDGTGWSQLLNDLAVKHAIDANAGRYYYGAVHAPYTSGIIGMGYVPSSAADSYFLRTAVGWDATGHRDGDNFPEVLAHEVGHNMGRSHAPCGSPAGPDSAYPYPGGGLGTWGYDSALGSLYSPLTATDIMSYCSPNWVSDYTVKGIIAFRNGSDGFRISGEDEASSSPSALVVNTLIVRGSAPETGPAMFLPAFRTRAQPTVLPTTGDYSIQCLDPEGTILYRTPVNMVEVGCGELRVRHFVATLAMAPEQLDALDEVDLIKGGEVLARQRAAGSRNLDLAATRPEVRRLDPHHVEILWDSSIYPAALVRDAGTGEVVAILAHGRQTLESSMRVLEVVMSDGLAGPTHRIQVKE